jgi:hypothetical protein
VIEAFGETVTEAPAEVVFDYLADARNEPACPPAHVNARMSARPRGLMRLAEPLMARTMKRQFAGKLGPPQGGDREQVAWTRGG